jgi:hypothetical protein
MRQRSSYADSADPDLAGIVPWRRRLQRAGVDLPSVASELEREGVRSFCNSYHQLLECIADKLGALARPGR